MEGIGGEVQERGVNLVEEAPVEFHMHVEKLKKYAIKEFEAKAMLAFALVHIVPGMLYRDKLREAYMIAKAFRPEGYAIHSTRLETRGSDMDGG